MAQQKHSPYSKARKIDYQDGDVSLERIPYNLTGSVSKNQVHTVLPGETLQGIAFKYYGDSGLWGLIAEANSIYDIWEEVVFGMELIIPVYGG